MRYTLIPAFIFSLALAIAPQQVAAFTFEKNLLITNKDLTDDTYLTRKGIENFLEEKGSVLANYRTTDIDGKERTVAQIIKRVSKKYDLNPMLFLVMAQKESSAITSSKMTYAIEHWVLGFGRCDSCSEADAAPYKGIARQFNSAAKQFRNGYLASLDARGTTVSGWGPGITKTTIDGIQVTPQNDATAALYTYNPCVGAYGGGYERFGCNSAFQKLWQEWNPARVRYPNGSLLNINGTVYLIQNGKKRAFTSRAALASSHNVKDVIAVPAVIGDLYKNGAPIQFPNYSILRSPSGTVYVLVNGKKRGIASAEALRQLGYHPEEILDVKWKEINPIPDGKPITVNTKNITGKLVQNTSNGAVSYVGPKNRIQPIWSKEVMENRFPNLSVQAESQAQIDSYKKGKPVKLADGTLVTSKKAKSVFVIANGKRRAFATKKAFNYYGYDWDRVITVPHNVLKLHKKGKIIDIPKSEKKKSKKASKKK